MSDWVEEGDDAPDFTVSADDGGQVRLSDFRGRPVVLYFYPKDDTPGCTKEACDIRDNWTKMQKAGVAVFGVSTQDNSPALASRRYTMIRGERIRLGGRGMADRRGVRPSDRDLAFFRADEIAGQGE